jgi:hypothetical protein
LLLASSPPIESWSSTCETLFSSPWQMAAISSGLLSGIQGT